MSDDKPLDLIAENARLRRERDDLMHGTSEFVANTVSRQTAALGAEVERLRRERDEARAQVSQVEALHEEQWSPHGPACTHCRDCYFDEPASWPCATIRALTDAAPPATDPSEQEAGR